MELKDKIVVITGGTKGLGKALALEFEQSGAKVIVSSRQGNDTENYIKADVRNENEVQSLAKTVIDKYGRIDIWINNAGIWLPHAPVEEIDMKRVHDMVEVNLFGTMYGAKAAIIQMRKQNFGTIINILSTSALEGRAGISGYGASKFAAMGFTQAIRKEVEEAGIKVVSIYPGGMQTNFFDEKQPANYQKYMDPQEVASKIVQNLQKDIPEEELIIKRPTA